MQESLLYVFERTHVYIDKEEPIDAPVCLYRRGLPLMLPERPAVFMCKNKGKQRHGYLKAYCGFDIETTNIISEDRKRAYMYIWQCCIATDTDAVVYLGRTWDDFLGLLEGLRKKWDVSPTEALIMWDANLGFEFQFLRNHLVWDQEEWCFFAKEERQPLLASWKGIQFRECLSISGGSLAQLAKDYTTTQKLVGDLDYSILRNSKTELSREEYGYCINDVVILAEWSKYVFESWLKHDKKVPLTKTGLLRSEVNHELKRSCKDIIGYKRMIHDAYPDEATYKMWFEYLFRGGYVHANAMLANRVLRDMEMHDITSSYPEVINSAYCPGRFRAVEPADYKRLIDEDKMCLIMLVDFYQIRNTCSHSIESYSKCIIAEGYHLDNGRIYEAEHITVMLTELDFKTYQKFYRWKDCIIRKMWAAPRMRFPGFLRRVLNRHYKHKAELKKQGLSGTPEYAIAKSGVNSAYGLCVTRLALDKVEYRNGEGWVLADVKLDYQKEVDKQVLLPQWGIWVAAHARYRLLSQVWLITQRCGDVVVYCDTDSIKALQHPLLKSCYDEFNKAIEERHNAIGLTDPDFYDLGMFDDERGKHTVTRFKTLGAKRYMVEMDGKEVKATIAGFPKKAIKSMGVDPFDAFKATGMYVQPEDSMKLTTAYIDEPSGDWVDGEWMEELSSVALYQIPFSMITDKDYYSLLIEAQEGRKSLGRRTGG